MDGTGAEPRRPIIIEAIGRHRSRRRAESCAKLKCIRVRAPLTKTPLTRFVVRVRYVTINAHVIDLTELEAYTRCPVKARVSSSHIG